MEDRRDALSYFENTLGALLDSFAHLGNSALSLNSAIVSLTQRTQRQSLGTLTSRSPVGGRAAPIP